MRLIDADKLIELLNKKYGDDENVNESVFYLVGAISGMPTVDAEPVKHGYWKGKPIAGYSTVGCSNCGDVFLENSGRWNYCPNCGAKMDEVKDVKYRMDKQRRIRL